MKWRMEMAENKVQNTKNEQKKNNFTILLFALLLIGMATYGTYAYFTDSTSIDSGLKLTTGTVNLENVKGDETPWVYSHDESVTDDNSNYVSDESYNELNSVQPGDVVTKEFTVEYKGTSDAVVTIDDTVIEEAFAQSGFDLNLTYATDADGKEVKKTDSEIEVKPEQKILVTAKVAVTNKEDESYSSEKDNRNNQTISLDNVANGITITAKQANAE